MKHFKKVICLALLVCVCTMFAACADILALEQFSASDFVVKNTEFLYDGYSKMFEVDYVGNKTDLDYVVSYSLTKDNFATAEDLNLVGSNINSVTYEVYYKVTAYGYEDYISSNAVSVKIVPEAVEVKVGENYTYFDSLEDAVAEVESSGIIKFYGDVTSAGVIVEAGKSIELNLNGYTFTPNIPVGSSGTVTLGLQLLKGSEVVVKNGTIKAGQPGIKMLINNYSDLILEDVVLDGRGLIGTGSNYVLSNNFGSVVIKGNTQILTDENDIAFDLWYGMYDVYNDGISVTFDSSFTGKIAGYIEYGAARNLENWMEKTVLTINGGDFEDATFKAGSSYANIAEANINLPQGWELVETNISGEYKIVK